MAPPKDLGRRLRVLVADDHTAIRLAIQGQLSTEFDVIGSVANGKDLLRDALALHPDVIVTDIAMPFLSVADPKSFVEQMILLSFLQRARKAGNLFDKVRVYLLRLGLQTARKTMEANLGEKVVQRNPHVRK
jgi:CheY-like chemotaxis protein